MDFWQAVAFLPTDELLELARAAEDAGFHGIMVSDHVFYPQDLSGGYPYTPTGMPIFPPESPWPDSYCLISAMAAVTTRLRFSNSVYIAGMRDIWTVARTVGTAAVISKDRVALGVGAGWMREEFEAFGVDFGSRGRRLDEMITALRTLWQPGWVEHHGEFFDFDRLEMSPAPTERVPVWVGGLSEPALRRAVRHDGWISDLQTTAELGEIAATLQRYRAELGRADEPFAVVGSAKDAVDLAGYRRLADAGVTHLVTWPWVFYSGFTDDLGARRDGIARFAEEIIGPFTSTTS